MGAASHVRGGTGGDGCLVPGPPRLVGAGVERSLPGVERAVPEGGLMRAMLPGGAGPRGLDLVATVPPDRPLFPFPRADLEITDRDASAARIREGRPCGGL